MSNPYVDFTKPANYNPDKLWEELVAQGFIPAGFTPLGTLVRSEFYEDWSGLTPAQRTSRENLVKSIAANHTGAKTAAQLAQEEELNKQGLEKAILRGLAEPPAANKIWKTDPNLPNRGEWVDMPAGSGTTLSVLYVPLVTVATAVLTNAPLGGVEPANQMSRVMLDLRGTVNCRVTARFSVIPAVTGTCQVEYSVDGGTTWAALANSGLNHTANVLKVGDITAVPAAAKNASTLLRVMVTGNGISDPVLQSAAINFMA